MKYALAVLDIGKTNKKLVIYDDMMNLVTIRKRAIDTISVDGLDLEDIETVVQWFLEELRDLSAQYNIKAISITTHGATLVCVDSQGKPSMSPVAYTNEVDDSVHKRFWETMGNPKDLQRQTATAEIKPLINVGKLLWYMKERWPEDFAKTSHILFYPQYFAYRLTGKVAADITSVGCHGYLWDFHRQEWSAVCDKLGIRTMLPLQPSLPGECLGTITRDVADSSGLSPDTLVTMGIHDSNSSLIPYLITQEKDFVLNSTGTWCVAMHPANDVVFEENELGKMVFYNLSFEAKPIKTSILMGGFEYSVYTDALMKHHQLSDWPDYDPQMYADILDNPRTFLLPTMLPGAGQFPEAVARVIDGSNEYAIEDILAQKVWPEAFNDYQSGFALANLSLAIQTRIALQRVGLTPGTKVFIEGGFRQNTNYGALLGALLPDNPLYLTSLDEATSFGAALIGKAAIDDVPIRSLKNYVQLDMAGITPARLDGLERYAELFLSHLT